MQSRVCAPCRAGDHRHHEPQFGGICIGCPCSWKPEGAEQALAEEHEADIESDRLGEQSESQHITELTDRVSELEGEKAKHLEFALHAEAGSQTLLMALDRMLASAHPTQEEHPAMFAAWEVARLARDAAPKALSTREDRAVMLHLVRLIQDSPDVRYYVGVGGRGSQMHELLCAAIAASGFKGEPAEALQPPEHRRDDEPRVRTLERELARLERQ